jgi:hypothetical protein
MIIKIPNISIYEELLDRGGFESCSQFFELEGLSVPAISIA